MLSYLEVENYRGFENFRMENLKRVNLLTGRNNSGKTALLEAVQLLIDSSTIGVIRDISQRRGEISPSFSNESSPSTGSIQHFFYGHAPTLGAEFNISAGNPSSSLFGKIVNAFADKSDDDDFRNIEFSRDGISIGYAKLREDFSFAKPTLYSSNTDGSKNGNPYRKIEFIGIGSQSSSWMVNKWNDCVIAQKEHLVERALRILIPSVSKITVLLVDSKSMTTGVLVDLEDTKKRMPIGSFGEGMTRMLTLALALASCANGFLLIDEIDTGLHYSVMDDMWKLVIKTAQELDVQVFATTHSQDCVRGLAYLCEDSTDLANEVSIQKIDPRLKHSIDSEATNLALMLEHHVEVR